PAEFAKPGFDMTKLDPRIVFNPREQQRYPDRDSKTGKPIPENRAKWVPYWKLSEGDEVVAGQVLCMLDDSMMNAEIEAAQKTIVAAKTGRKQAQRGVDLSEAKIALYKGKPSEPLVAEVDKLNDLTT